MRDMKPWDWFWAVACVVLTVSNAVRGDAAMAAVGGVGCGMWLLIVLREAS